MKEKALRISHIDSTFHLQKSTRENKGDHDGLVHLTRGKERKEKKMIDESFRWINVWFYLLDWPAQMKKDRLWKTKA